MPPKGLGGLEQGMQVAAHRSQPEAFASVYDDRHAHKDTESHMGAGMTVAALKPGEVASASMGSSAFSMGIVHQQHHVASGTMDIDGDGKLDMLGSKNVSVDAPDWFKVPHASVNTESAKTLKRLKNAGRPPGRQQLDGQLNIADRMTPRSGPKSASFNPTTGGVRTVRPPQVLPLKDSLLPSRVRNARLSDPRALENRHRRAITTDANAFYRRKGPLEEYLEQAHSSSDMLVWQQAQQRGDAASNGLRFRPNTDFYDTMPELGDTSRLATSPLLLHRHRLARSSATTLGPSVMVSRQQAALRESQSASALLESRSSTRAPRFPDEGPEGALDSIRRFERTHHQQIELQDYDKHELKALIEAEGLEVPGKMYWDAGLGKLVKEDLPKKTYVDFARRALYGSDAKPLVRRGCNLTMLGGTTSPTVSRGGGKRRAKPATCYCVVSLLRARKGGVRVLAYEHETSREHQLLLIPSRLEDLDVLAAPDAPDDDAKAWEEWGFPLIERLMISPTGELKVGPPPLKDNGLPQVFSLAGQGIKGSDAQVPQKDCDSHVVKDNLPSRMHVTMFFNMM